MFSKLEQDEKTRKIIMKFIKYHMDSGINLNKSIFHFTHSIQCDEIKEHLKNNGFQKDDAREKIRWIDNNASNYRMYLNTCQKVALAMINCIINKTLKRTKIDDGILNNFIKEHNEEP